MSHTIDQDQEKMWQSVQTLLTIQPEQARVVLKATVEHALRRMGAKSPAIPRLLLPQMPQLMELREIERDMRRENEGGDREKAYEYLMDYIDAVSRIAEEDPGITRKKLVVSVMLANDRAGGKLKQGKFASKFKPQSTAEIAFYTPSEAGKKLGLSSQTIRRMCEQNKFKGAFQTDGGHWRIPEDNFITTREQDQRADAVFERIDRINREAGEVDEFDI